VYAFLPFWLRNTLSNLRLFRASWSCECEACMAWWRAHHWSCCDCRSCRDYAPREARCWLCDANSGVSAGEK